MSVEEDTAPAENTSTKIINRDGITTAEAETIEDVYHLKSGNKRGELCAIVQLYKESY